MIGHQPQRPRWTCLVCDHPWPCRTAKLALVAEYTGMSATLGVYMTSQAIVAGYDLGDQITAGDLLRRFLGWIGTAP